MKRVTFKFNLKSTGRLENVWFYPEDEHNSIIIERDASRTKWINKEFTLLVQDPFEYKLRVFGISGTKWEAEVKIQKGQEWAPFIAWKGETGDTRRNISIRTKPEINIP